MSGSLVHFELPSQDCETGGNAFSIFQSDETVSA